MSKAIIFILTAILLFALQLNIYAKPYQGNQTVQNQKQAQIDEIIQAAESCYKKGEAAFKSSQYDTARHEFDAALDKILIAPIEVRSDNRLHNYYQQLIDLINGYQIASLDQKDGGFNQQRYEPSPLDKTAALSPEELEEVGAADVVAQATPTTFNFDVTTADPVRQFISYFTKGKGRVTMEAGFNRSVKFREMATRVFQEEGVPTDLIWLAQVESGWNPYAVSAVGAKGIWQFMPGTGATYGLSKNYWVDERANPEKSTRAAARYLKSLMKHFNGSWTLALAAYNTGAGHVDTAISRSGNRDFWALHSAGYLARETRNYVPAILAVISIAKNPRQYGFSMPPAYAPKYETRAIAKQTDLRPLSKQLNVSYNTLLEMNPELQRGMTPPGQHLIQIPATSEKTVENGVVTPSIRAAEPQNVVPVPTSLR